MSELRKKTGNVFNDVDNLYKHEHEEDKTLNTIIESLSDGNIVDFSNSSPVGSDYFIPIKLYKGVKYTFSGDNYYKSFRTSNDTSGVVAGNENNKNDVVYTPTETRTFYLRWYGQASDLRIVADKIIADLDNRVNEVKVALDNVVRYASYTTDVDANAIHTERGIYVDYVNTSNGSNLPNGSHNTLYGILITFYQQDSFRAQIAIDSSGLYHRRYWGGWGDWYKATSTQL